MTKPKFDDAVHWLSAPTEKDLRNKVYFKDLKWSELVPGLIWGAEYQGWYLTISNEGRVDVSNSPKHKR